MISITFEYRCDFCNAEIVGAETYQHGADYGRYPVPRHVAKVGSAHACIACAAVAAEALRADRVDRAGRTPADAPPLKLELVK